MRTSEYYGVQVPELGDRADITVVSQAIIDSEDNQSGKVENMKASLSGSIISLVSECRTDKLVKYYNGLAVQFISPVNAQAGTAYKIKVDNLAEQPYNNKVDIKVGDIVQAIYGGTGFVSANTPIPRSSSTSSISEVTVATSLAVKNANDNANTRALKTVQVVAGKGLTGGGDMSTNRTIDVVSKNDGIIVNDNDIQLNVYDGVDSTSTTRAGSARAVKMAYDKSVEAMWKYEPRSIGSLSGSGIDLVVQDLNDIKVAGVYVSGATEYSYKNTPNKNDGVTDATGLFSLEVYTSKAGRVLQRLTYMGSHNARGSEYIRHYNQNTQYWSDWKRILIDADITSSLDVTQDGYVLDGKVGKMLEDKKQNKTDDSLESTDKNIVPAINKAFHSNIPTMNLKPNTRTWNFLDEIVQELEMGTYSNVSNATVYENVPEGFERSNFTYELMPTSYQNFKSINKDEVGKDLMLRLCGRSGFSTNYWNHWTESWHGWTNYLSDKSKLFLGQLGVSAINYIQTAGTKTKDNIYIDKTTGKPYRAKATNTDVTVTTNFEPADNLSNSYDFSEKIVIESEILSGNASTSRGFCNLQFQKLGRLVFVSGTIRTLASPGTIPNFTIPSKFRPAQDVTTRIQVSGHNITPASYVYRFGTNGQIAQLDGTLDFTGVVNLIYKTN